MRSFMVPEGYTLVVYEGDEYTGASETYHGQQDENGMLICQPQTGALDGVLSLKVMKDAELA